MKNWIYFDVDEFKCSCCGEFNMSYEFIDKLDALRHNCKFPFVITSGYRCLEHNRAVGGATNSAHRLGRAVDISLNNAQKYTLLNVMPSLRLQGFGGIGVSKNFIHLDDLTAEDRMYRPALWTY